MTIPLDEALKLLADQAGAADRDSVWPAASWTALREADVLGWCVPEKYGGNARSPADILAGNAKLAAACMTTCFILSQREAAVRRILASNNEELCERLLPALARGETFATVGLSQLTTSRQYGKAALVAREEKAVVVLDGTIPWVTGAAQADHLIIGAVLEDDRQILAALPGKQPGVSVQPALELMALQGSLTAQIKLSGVVLPREWVLAGPADKVLTAGKAGTGGLETSCLALGLARGAIDFLKQEAGQRSEFQFVADRLDKAQEVALAELLELAEKGGTPEAALALRARANALVLRATQSALTASKGTGFLRNHPAQRWARQALFFLVWSCPRPAVEATLEYLAGPQACDL
ncbi:MAG: acyl-CoA dehydrogenase family protein [Gemmataceae bacterium]